MFAQHISWTGYSRLLQRHYCIVLRPVRNSYSSSHLWRNQSSF